MTKVNIERAAQLLKTQAVGVGEVHNDKTARLVIVQWIYGKLVSDLVLELEEGGNPGYLRYGEWESLGDLWNCALRNGVKVHLWDKPKLDPEAKRAPSTRVTLSERNRHVAKKFGEYFGDKDATKAPRCVLLFGDFHFEEREGKSLTHLIKKLQWTDIGMDHPKGKP